MRQFLAAVAALALIPAAGSLQAAAVSEGSSASPISVNAPAVKSVSVVPASGRAEIVIGVDASIDVGDTRTSTVESCVGDVQSQT